MGRVKQIKLKKQPKVPKGAEAESDDEGSEQTGPLSTGKKRRLRRQTLSKTLKKDPVVKASVAAKKKERKQEAKAKKAGSPKTLVKTENSPNKNGVLSEKVKKANKLAKKKARKANAKAKISGAGPGSEEKSKVAKTLEKMNTASKKKKKNK